MRSNIEKTLLRTILPWRVLSSGTSTYTRNVITKKTQLILPLTVFSILKTISKSPRQLAEIFLKPFKYIQMKAYIGNKFIEPLKVWNGCPLVIKSH